MRIRPWIVDGLLILSLVAVASGIYRLNLTLESPRAAVGQPGEIGALPDGRVLRVLALGFERLVADLFWLRTVAYVGDDNVAAAGYPSAGALAELVTDIDPGFTSVYVLMNTLLESLCGEPDAAIALLDKGLRHNDYWRLHFLQGFNYFFHKHDYARAATQMQLAAERGGPAYLPLLVTRLYTEAGSLDTAIAFVQARLAQASTAEEREMLETRLQVLYQARESGETDALRLQLPKGEA
ncbi:MAG: hypothetical protein HRU00_16790 [Myxococcales bacterium]|nr:hypothetical protein [Myxococcales bacterium]